MLDGSKNINIEVSKECWKALKKISIDKEITLQKVVQEILERSMNKKIKINDSVEDN